LARIACGAFWGLVAALLALAGCGRAPHHPDWVIHCAIEVIGPPPEGGYRLIFPYIVGDFYGPPDTGDFVAPVSRMAGGFTLDLNRTQAALESELAPADFSLRLLKAVPADTRLARLAPEALQRNGIDPVGMVQWSDADSPGPLMLVYIDRQARIAGAYVRGGETTRYDIRVAAAGYVWIAGIRAGGHDTLYTVVPAPKHLVLTINTKTTAK